MKVFLVGCSFLFLVALSGAAYAQNLIAIDAADPPFMYEADGRPASLYPALIAEAYRRIGIAVTITTMPWKRAIDEGRSGIGGLYKTTSRLEKYDYSDKLFDEILQIYVRKGHGFPFATIDDLAGRTIGVIRGWSYGDAFDDARRQGLFAAEEASGDAQNFAVLEVGHIDCILAIHEAGLAVIRRRHLEERVEALTPPLSNIPTFIAFNKSAGKRDELSRFDAALAAMRLDGSFDRIARRALDP